MRTQLLALPALIVIVSASPAQDPPIDRMPSYPIRLSPEEVYEYPEFSIDYRELELRSGPVVVVPISCEPGVTGAMLIGDGTYRFSPPDGKPIEGHFRAAMLRFNPEDAARFMPPEKRVKSSDSGAYELARHVVRGVFPRCWQSSIAGQPQEALIPTKGILAMVLLSREHGELLISGLGKKVIVESNLNKRRGQPLYEQK